MAFKVNITQLEGVSAKLVSLLEQMDEEYSAATKAGEKAVEAAGGAGTPVGGAISEAIKSDTDTQYGQAHAVIDEMIAAMNQVSHAYSEENTHLLDQIKKITANAEASGSSGGGGSSNKSTNFNAMM